MTIERLNEALAALHGGHAPVPRAEDIFIGDGDYTAIAAEFLSYFVTVAGLKPDHRVLDIGSGIGRMACGLRLFLDPQRGSYLGFDPVQEGVAWCRQAYAGQEHFRFEWVDLYNELYKPDGTILSTEFVFPVEASSVDLAIATSVFTHLYEPEIAAYLRQTARALTPEGRLFATAYLHDGDRPAPSDRPHLVFDQQDRDYPHRWHVEGAPPLSAVCFSEEYFAQLVAENTGRRADIRPGRWRGGPGPWFQDLVLI
ncbi:methyltransferase [Rhizobium sp. FKL33]|uniref:methyltransferase n=1 Tax=Rhizobium sp. FKL33 TaxID=2562307 RepID=UPI0010C0655A|nr:methyltransferase [Rhizobium sp. FKL33]